MAKSIVVDHKRLLRAVTDLLRASGSKAREAGIVAEHLVEANLKGHDSHGVGIIPHYMRNLAAGTLVLNGRLAIVRDDGPFLLADGGLGHGQVMARALTDRAIAKARKHGIAVAGLQHAHHIGRVGAYGERCAAAGMVSLHFVNVSGHGPIVAPFRGTDARYCTNPICLTVPATGRQPALILDFATSKVALGKVRVAMNKGVAMAPGMILDGKGRASTDPRVMFGDPMGAVLPFGEHKGYGLALFAELLGAALVGGRTIAPHHARKYGIVNNMLEIVIDPRRLGGRNALLREIDAMVDYVKASPPAKRGAPVLVPGEPERLTMAERRKAGIPIDGVTWAELGAAAETVGLGRAAFVDTARGRGRGAPQERRG